MSLTTSEIHRRIARLKELANQCLIEVDEALMQIARLEKALERMEAL